MTTNNWVVFRASRKDPSNVTAVFPDWACYAHIGQHSGYTNAWYYTTRPAAPKAYAALLAELTQIYGPLKVLRRRPLKHANRSET